MNGNLTSAGFCLSAASLAYFGLHQFSMGVRLRPLFWYAVCMRHCNELRRNGTKWHKMRRGNELRCMMVLELEIEDKEILRGGR